MKILDLFSGGSHANGAPTTELPSDGATGGQVRSVLEGLSNAVDGVTGVVNAFKGDVKDGKAVQTVITQPAPASVQTKPWLFLGLAAAAAAVWYFFLRGRK